MQDAAEAVPMDAGGRRSGRSVAPRDAQHAAGDAEVARRRGAGGASEAGDKDLRDKHERRERRNAPAEPPLLSSNGNHRRLPD